MALSASAAGWAIVTPVLALQPWASVTVTLYVPAHVPGAGPGTGWVGPRGPHRWRWGDAPPPPVGSIARLLPPLQLTSVWVALSASAAAGWPTVTLRVAVQPLASVTVTL